MATKNLFVQSAKRKANVQDRFPYNPKILVRKDFHQERTLKAH